MTTMVI